MAQDVSNDLAIQVQQAFAKKQPLSNTIRLYVLTHLQAV